MIRKNSTGAGLKESRPLAFAINVNALNSNAKSVQGIGMNQINAFGKFALVMFQEFFMPHWQRLEKMLNNHRGSLRSRHRRTRN
jgi:hypothetical protein